MFFVAHSDPVKPRSKLCGLNFVCCLSMNILQGFIGRWEDNMFKKKALFLTFLRPTMTKRWRVNLTVVKYTGYFGDFFYIHELYYCLKKNCIFRINLFYFVTI